MEATGKEIDVYIQKKTMNIRDDQVKINEANKIVRELMALKRLKEDVESPVVQYLMEELERLTLAYAKNTLNGSKIEPENSVECKCGERIDVNKVYYQVYVKAYNKIVGIIDKWNKKNIDIAKASRR